MDIEELIKQTLSEILDQMQASYTGIEIEQDDNSTFVINILSENPSELIGYHGNTIFALQQLLKVILWKKSGHEDFHIRLDIDNYRIRQEENAINLALRKAARVRQIRKAQTLPPMSAFLRRKVHLHFMGPGYEDLETLSAGEGDDRHIVIQPKS